MLVAASHQLQPLQSMVIDILNRVIVAGLIRQGSCYSNRRYKDSGYKDRHYKDSAA